MVDITDTLVEQSLLTCNWMTTFVVVQSLGFCYALAKECRFSQIMDHKPMSLGVMEAMAGILVLILLGIHWCYENTRTLCEIRPGSSAANAVSYQKVIRIAGTLVYGVLPIGLFCITKIHPVVRLGQDNPCVKTAGGRGRTTLLHCFYYDLAPKIRVS